MSWCHCIVLLFYIYMHVHVHVHCRHTVDPRLSEFFGAEPCSDKVNLIVGYVNVNV